MSDMDNMDGMDNMDDMDNMSDMDNTDGMDTGRESKVEGRRSAFGAAPLLQARLCSSVRLRHRSGTRMACKQRSVRDPPGSELTDRTVNYRWRAAKETLAPICLERRFLRRCRSKKRGEKRWAISENDAVPA